VEQRFSAAFRLSSRGFSPAVGGLWLSHDLQGREFLADHTDAARTSGAFTAEPKRDARAYIVRMWGFVQKEKAVTLVML